ncbi:MAG: ribulose-phosphate 3-epimerase, partial [Proteobacteria bacterium]|nr:ribulose-phosphate 3-epimerase [Pseudomonadota bacterium]
MPDEFLPVVENTGLITPLTLTVLDLALAAVAEWRAAGHDVTVAVNLSVRHLTDLGLPRQVDQALRKHGVTAPIDVHLMVEPVDRIVPDFAKAGASIISFHPEASAHVHRTVQLIKSHGCQAGLVLNPATPVEVLDWVLDELDLVLLMSVNPGFGGQSFIPSTLEKLRRVRQRIDRSGRAIRLEVDGGISSDTIGACAEAGADTFVAGSAVFDRDDRPRAVAAIMARVPRPAGSSR